MCWPKGIFRTGVGDIGGMTAKPFSVGDEYQETTAFADMFVTRSRIVGVHLMPAKTIRPEDDDRFPAPAVDAVTRISCSGPRHRWLTTQSSGQRDRRRGPQTSQTLLVAALATGLTILASVM